MPETTEEDSFDFNIHADRLKAFKLQNWNMNERSMKSAKRLSTLGFFPSPNTELPKGVTCFYCKLVVDSTENAFDLHLGEAPCSFAKLRRNLKVGDSSFQKQLDKCHPVTIDVTEELLKTFTAWPHGEGRSQTTPTAEEVANAGFMKMQYDREADDVLCLSCSANLNLWEEGDDPLEEHRKRNSKCALVVAAMKRKKVVENLEESETVVVAEDKPVKVVSVSTKIKAGKAKPKTRRGAAEETVTEVETATEIATETETGTEAEKEVEEIPEPLVAAKPKKGKGKVTSKRGKGKAVEEVELLDDSENADKVQGLTPESVKDQEEPITKSKRGSKGPVDSNPKRARKALETAVIANIPVPDKNDPKKLGAYMELIHDSTPVNSILTKEMLVTIFEENSEKTLADFLGVLGQKAGRVLDELMAIE